MPAPAPAHADPRFQTLGSRALSFTVPGLRLAGFVTLSTLVAIHALTDRDPGSWTGTAWYAALSLTYAAAGWAILWTLRSHALLKTLASRAAEIDILFWAGALMLTDGGDSWLFPLMTLRAADHLTFGRQRVLVLGHISTLAFVGVLWLSRDGGLAAFRAQDWARLSIVYGINLYLSWAAAAVDRLNARLKQTRDSLQEAKLAAEESSRAKSSFLAAMSHELRTPLNAIIGYAELIDDEHGAEKGLREDLGRIQSAGRHLLAMVNDLLDVAKIDAGRMDIAPVDLDVTRTVHEMAAFIAPLAQERGLALRVEAPSPVWIRADEARVRQVLLNLLSNACKFTERGSVTLTVRPVDAADTTVTIDVADTGIGIAADQLARVFDEFVQVDASPTRRHGGTGLGLALTRRFCDLMGGTVSVVSEPGRGSTFSVRLPLAHPTSSTSAVGTAPEFPVAAVR